MLPQVSGAPQPPEGLAWRGCHARRVWESHSSVYVRRAPGNSSGENRPSDYTCPLREVGVVFRGDRQGFRVREKGRVRPAVFSFHSPCSGEAYSRIPVAGREYPVPLPPSCHPRPTSRLEHANQMVSRDSRRPFAAQRCCCHCCGLHHEGNRGLRKNFPSAAIVRDTVGRTGPWRMVQAHLSPSFSDSKGRPCASCPIL